MELRGVHSADLVKVCIFFFIIHLLRMGKTTTLAIRGLSYLRYLLSLAIRFLLLNAVSSVHIDVCTHHITPLLLQRAFKELLRGFLSVKVC